MSSVKIHLPYYTEKILLKMIELMNNNNLIVQNIDEFKKKIDGNKPSLDILYNKIGNFIFTSKHDNIFLIGDTKNLMLPIPLSSKVLLKDTSVSSSQKKRYILMGYTELTEKEIINELLNYLNSSSKHTCGFEKKNGTLAKFDVFKLWFYSYGMQATKFDVDNIMEYVYGTANIDEIKKIKLWNNTTLNNINKYPDHARRLNDADINVPILMTIYNGSPKMLDGVHRLIKSFVTGEKYINVIIMDNKMIKKAEI